MTVVVGILFIAEMLLLVCRMLNLKRNEQLLLMIKRRSLTTTECTLAVGVARQFFCREIRGRLYRVR